MNHKLRSDILFLPKYRSKMNIYIVFHEPIAKGYTFLNKISFQKEQNIVRNRTFTWYIMNQLRSDIPF